MIQSYPLELCNLSSHSKAFSYCADQGKYGWLYDIPNCTFEEGLVFLEKSMGCSNVSYFQIGMSYTPWKIQDDKVASLTQGNQIRCSVKSQKATITIGMEQYGDHDIPVKNIRKSLEKQLAPLGLYLK
jgi:hypothetical protein